MVPRAMGCAQRPLPYYTNHAVRLMQSPQPCSSQHHIAPMVRSVNFATTLRAPFPAFMFTGAARFPDRPRKSTTRQATPNTINHFVALDKNASLMYLGYAAHAIRSPSDAASSLAPITQRIQREHRSTPRPGLDPSHTIHFDDLDTGTH